MKQFNLKEYLANPNRKVVTRDGHPARIICTDRKGSNQPILALVQVRADPIEVALTFGTDGSYDIWRESNYDLFFVPEKHEGWVNIYRHIKYGDSFCGSVYSSVEEAKEHATSVVVATTKIEWEE